ncbi:MAG TPA: hypothetical protein V6C76_04190 [Drouetiella sp.]
MMQNKPEHVENQILGMLKNDVSEEVARQTVVAAGGKILKTSTNGRLTTVLIEASNVDQVFAALESSGKFDALQLNHISKHC